MRLVIVPNVLRDAINARLDDVLRDAPAEAIAEREHLYQQVLAYYDEHGVIPECSVVKSA
ncbi:MAG: hypothetical protein Q8R92_05535 [Deltaproteobacteria bacterium]|nr:hypothetical protein [Deltaproteobacteria bacterium]